MRAYVLPDGTFRDCCATYPTLVSSANQTFEQWWFHDARLQDFRQLMLKQEFPPACHSCKIQDSSNNSLRQAINRNNSSVRSGVLPCEWSIMFGNVCNLACWTCDEMFSSTIAAHKKRLGIVSTDRAQSNDKFMAKWPELRKNILDSYRQHDRITLVLLGGEPSYNPVVLEFLQHIHDQGLAPQTRIELTTNGTKSNEEFFHLITSPNWLSVSVFVSVDAVGSKAEWLRYGSKWPDVENNIKAYARNVYHMELHTVVSVLNVMDLPAVHDFAKQHNLHFTAFPLRQPEHMSLANWDGPSLINDPDAYAQRGLDQYVELIGSQAKAGSRQQLADYINAFGSSRRSLHTVDSQLASIILDG